MMYIRKSLKNTAAAMLLMLLAFTLSFKVYAGDEAGQVMPSGTSEAVQEPTEHITWNSCVVENNQIIIKGTQDGQITSKDTEMGADTNFYLLELKPYEDSIANHRNVASAEKADQVTFTLPLNSGKKDDRLYNRFVVCVWTGETYKTVSESIYVTNPEAVAKNTKAYKEPLSKKGLLIEIEQISDAFQLGVCNVIINIPFDTLLGKGIDYSYDGETYHFACDKWRKKRNNLVSDDYEDCNQ